ncbi:hypothetical protein [Streptomyces achromogenes]|uniref:hypothetical protein n=1 Tax=Streptomyces achromogenes TaxID=67255 RepID=UPI0036B7E7A2
MEAVRQPGGDDGLSHHCLRDAPLWTACAATSCRRSEVLGWKWSLIHWDECAIQLAWVVVEEGNTSHLPENFRLHDWRASKITNDASSAAESACHPWPDQQIRSAVGHVVGHATARETEKPQVNWGFFAGVRGGT